MRPEAHLDAFEERKETIMKWAVEVRGIDNSQRIIGDNASRAIAELLSAFLHKNHKIEEGFQLNHSWFKSEKVMQRLPEFDGKQEIVSQMIALEKVCEKLSYGVPHQKKSIEESLLLFRTLEEQLKGMLHD